MNIAENIKDKIIQNLKLQGFELKNDKLIINNDNLSKENLRLIHKNYKDHIFEKENAFIKNNFHSLLKYFADGKDINIEKFKPKLIIVKPNSDHSRLFRLTSLLWSVPVSQGYGRRIRFVVLDEFNQKLIGIFALGDPVFNLKERDTFIGWDYITKMNNLYYILDLFVAGAIPPYSNLLCGKLITMLSTTNEIRNIVWKKYINKESNIRKIKRKPFLTLITTSSSLGRSSQYNRIKYKDKMLFHKIGESSGWGHFHLSNGTYSLMRDYLSSIDHKIVKSNRFGNGPNWKIRLIRTALEEIGLSPDLLNHGIKRELYLCPLASNYKEFLNGQETKPIFHNYTINEISSFFIERYFIPRSQRKKEYLNVIKEDYLQDFIKLI